MSWQAASVVIGLGAVAGGLVWYERLRPSSKLVALVATLVGLAVLGRLAFAPLPNVKPTTDIVLFSGYVLGGAPGAAVGALTALVSNFFFGQGPWTPWQMLAWGLVGAGGAALARVGGRRLGRWPLALACAFAGLGFGAIMDLFTWITLSGAGSPRAYLGVAVASAPFNAAHAAGNVVFALALGPAMIGALERYRRRLEVRWSVASAGVGGAGLVAVVATAIGIGVLLGPTTSARAAATVTEQAVSYLEQAQNADGGFGADEGQASSQLYTGWVALGLEAGGVDPARVQRSGHSIIDYMRAQARSLRGIGDLERTVLALEGAGIDSRRFAGRNLVGELVGRQRASGSFGGLCNLTAFGVLALRAARVADDAASVRRATAWLAAQQHRDGGFSLSRRDRKSDVDVTAAAVQALVAGGRRSTRGVGRAVAFLRRAQNGDGGFGEAGGWASNTQSTAWALQGLAAAGTDSPAALRYLRRLQRLDGSFAYSATAVQTPVWVTAQAIPALAGRPFPLPPAGQAARQLAAVSAAQHAGGAGSGAGSAPARPAARASGAAVSDNGEVGEAAAAAPPAPAGSAQLAAQAAPAAQDGPDRLARWIGLGLILAGVLLLGFVRRVSHH